MTNEHEIVRTHTHVHTKSMRKTLLLIRLHAIKCRLRQQLLRLSNASMLFSHKSFFLLLRVFVCSYGEHRVGGTRACCALCCLAM